MYVCNCNGLNSRAVNDAIADGASTTAAVFRKLDCRPQCGKCVCDIRSLITSCRHRDAHGSAPAYAAGCGGCAVEAPPFLMAAE